MDTGSLIGFVTVMVALAALPSASVVLVVSRAATAGRRQGLAVAAGIVLGDLALAALAIFGMSWLAGTVGGAFTVLRYAGGAYLIWLGWRMLTARPPTGDARSTRGSRSTATSVAAGLALTLGDVKAVLFYASLFPNLFELTTLTAADITLLFAVTAVTVGGVKSAYALAAEGLYARLRGAAADGIARRLPGAVVMGAGAWVVAKS